MLSTDLEIRPSRRHVLLACPGYRSQPGWLPVFSRINFQHPRPGAADPDACGQHQCRWLSGPQWFRQSEWGGNYSLVRVRLDQLRISNDDWARLQLCLRPRSEQFLQDVTTIAKEFAAKPFVAFLHPDDAEAGIDRFAQMVAGQIERYALEKRFVHNSQP